MGDVYRNGSPESSTELSPYRRFLRAWVAIIGVELLVGLLALYVSVWFSVPFLGGVFLMPAILRGIDCPKCGTPLTYQGSIAGIRVSGGFPHKTCRECGCDLSKGPYHGEAARV